MNVFFIKEKNSFPQDLLQLISLTETDAMGPRHKNVDLALDLYYYRVQKCLSSALCTI